MASGQGWNNVKIWEEAVILETSHANKESGCNFGQSQVHNSQYGWKLPRCMVRHGPAWSVLVLRRFSGKEVVDVLKEKLKAGRGTPLWTAPCCNRQAALAQEDKNVEELAQVPGPQVLGNVTQWYWQDKTSRQKLCWHEILPSTYLHAGSNPPPPLTTMLTVNACRRSGKGFLPG